MKSDQGWHDEGIGLYEGTWEPFVRDIDPSMPLRKTKEVDEDNLVEHWWFQEKHNNWGMSDQDWMSNSGDLPNASSLINIVDENGEEWLTLEAYPEWAEPKLIGLEKWNQPHKRMWYHIRSYLISENDSQRFIDGAVLQDYKGRWMPETSSRYQVFEREYYWAPSFKYFNNYYYGGLEHHKVKFRGKGRKPYNIILTSSNYSWEKSIDSSIERSFNILKPSEFIYRNMKLTPTEKVAEFSDENNSILCFSPSVYSNSKPCLLIKKQEFISFLEEHKLRIVWTLLGEKNIVGGRHLNSFKGRLEISGAYYLDQNHNVDGSTNTKIDK